MNGPRIALFGAVSDLGQKRPGVSLAPGVLRRAGLVDRLLARGAWVRDAGDFEGARAGAEAVTMGEWAEHSGILARQTEIAARDGELALTLGGDHSVALGTIAGLLNAHPDLGVVWVDAHGDLNRPESSPSGNFHGMPLAALLGLFGDDQFGGFRRNRLSASRLALIGIRDLDPFEREALRELPISAYTVDDVRDRGISAVVNDALARIGGDGNPLHLSFDVDALDPAYAPSTGCRVTNGLTLGEARAICRTMASSQRLVGMDVVEVNPMLCPFRGAVERTIDSALELIDAAIPATKSGLRTSLGRPEVPAGALLH